MTGLSDTPEGLLLQNYFSPCSCGACPGCQDVATQAGVCPCYSQALIDLARHFLKRLRHATGPEGLVGGLLQMERELASIGLMTWCSHMAAVGWEHLRAGGCEVKAKRRPSDWNKHRGPR